MPKASLRVSRPLPQANPLGVFNATGRFRVNIHPKYCMVLFLERLLVGWYGGLLFGWMGSGCSFAFASLMKREQQSALASLVDLDPPGTHSQEL